MGIVKVAIDDNILIRDKVSTAGSQILYNFIPPFSAAVIDRLTEAGTYDIKQSKPNEFGLSLLEPFGCVDLVAKGEADIGLGCDINGSIRKEASSSGLNFIKPTYGTVSRFGLVSTAASMEQIGVLCRDIDAGFEALSLIAGFDERDGAMADTVKYVYRAVEKDLKGIRIGVPDDCFEALSGTAGKLKALGAKVGVFDSGFLDYAGETAYIISAAEASNSISRFDGIKFGYRTKEYSNLEDVYLKSRTECFAFETKLMTLTGMLALSKGYIDEYFNKSLRTRRWIKTCFDDLYEKFDAVLTPAKCSLSVDRFEAFTESYNNLKYLALPNLTGCPAVSVPGGIQFIAKALDENTLFRVCKCLGPEVAR